MWFIDFSCKGFLLFSLTILSLPSPFYTIYGVRFYKVWEGNRHETRRKRYWLDLNVDSEAEERSERWCWCCTSKVLALLYSQGFFSQTLNGCFFPLEILMPMINILVKYVLVLPLKTLKYWCLWAIYLWNMYLFSLLYFVFGYNVLVKQRNWDLRAKGFAWCMPKPNFCFQSI
jgi:hypothetical protein